MSLLSDIDFILIVIFLIIFYCIQHYFDNREKQYGCYKQSYAKCLKCKKRCKYHYMAMAIYEVEKDGEK